jgi:hypothetical protein
MTSVLILLVSLGAAEAQQFSDWSPPVNVGMPVNGAGVVEQEAFISKDGLSLYFSCDCPGGFGGNDIWVSRRATVGAPWGIPENLGPNVNTQSGESGAALSPDGHWLYFNSGRPGGFGGNDLYVSRRRNKRDDLGWQPAVNLGSGVNTAANEQFPTLFEDDESEVIFLYFTSTRTSGLGDNDIYVSTLRPDEETFGPAELVVELSSAFNDQQPSIRRDGREMFFSSNRPGSFGTGANVLDLWVSTRQHTSEPWSPPVNLGSVVNSPFREGGPAVSFNGRTLYFHSTRAGGLGPCTMPAGEPCVFDLWATTRTKVHGDDDRDDRDDDHDD